MDKKSTLFCFINTYHNEKISLGKLNLTGKENDVRRNREEKEYFSPSAKAVNAILNFAKSYDVIHSKAVGCIEMNRN